MLVVGLVIALAVVVAAMVKLVGSQSEEGRRR